MPIITRVIIALVLTWTLAEPSFSASNIIDLIADHQQCLVTVKGQILNRAPEQQRSAAFDPNTRKIVILQNQKTQMLEKTGAGVIIDPTGIIAVNTHTIYGSQIIRVILDDNTSYTAQVLYVSPAYDFSLLQIKASRPLPAIEWADPKTIALGSEVITVGHSPLLQRTISGGSIIGLGTRETPQGPSAELMRLNINHYEGDSGGPVFDRDGRFLGMINAKITQQDRAVLAIPATKIYFAYINLVNPTEKK